MKKYIHGFLINLLNLRISKFILIDNLSIVKSKTKIYSFCQIFNSNIGSYTYVSRKTSIIHANIGAYCSIAGGVKIGMGTHNIKSVSSSPAFYSKNNALGITFAQNNNFTEFKRVEIGNDVWIGARAMIMSGIKIGHGAVIGAGAIVTKDVPNYAVVVGVPAKTIKYRFSKKSIKILIESEWWNWPEEIIRDKLQLFQNDLLDEEMLMLLKK